MRYVIVSVLLILFIATYAGIIISIENYINKKEKEEIEAGKKVDKRAEDYCI